MTSSSTSSVANVTGITSNLRLGLSHLFPRSRTATPYLQRQIEVILWSWCDESFYHSPECFASLVSRRNKLKRWRKTTMSTWPRTAESQWLVSCFGFNPQSTPTLPSAFFSWHPHLLLSGVTPHNVKNLAKALHDVTKWWGGTCYPCWWNYSWSWPRSWCSLWQIHSFSHVVYIWNPSLSAHTHTLRLSWLMREDLETEVFVFSTDKHVAEALFEKKPTYSALTLR